jgi:hypothetical protein
MPQTSQHQGDITLTVSSHSHKPHPTACLLLLHPLPCRNLSTTKELDGPSSTTSFAKTGLVAVDKWLPRSCIKLFSRSFHDNTASGILKSDVTPHSRTTSCIRRHLRLPVQERVSFFSKISFGLSRFLVLVTLNDGELNTESGCSAGVIS